MKRSTIFLAIAMTGLFSSQAMAHGHTDVSAFFSVGPSYGYNYQPAPQIVYVQPRQVYVNPYYYPPQTVVYPSYYGDDEYYHEHHHHHHHHDDED